MLTMVTFGSDFELVCFTSLYFSVFVGIFTQHMYDFRSENGYFF